MKTSKIATINANVKNTQRTINEMKKQKCAHKRLWYCKRANVNENDEKQYGTALLSFRIQIDLSLVLVSSIETRRVYMRNVVITCVSAKQVLKIYIENKPIQKQHDGKRKRFAAHVDARK